MWIGIVVGLSIIFVLFLFYIFSSPPDQCSWNGEVEVHRRNNYKEEFKPEDCYQVYVERNKTTYLLNTIEKTCLNTRTNSYDYAGCHAYNPFMRLINDESKDDFFDGSYTGYCKTFQPIKKEEYDKKIKKLLPCSCEAGSGEMPNIVESIKYDLFEIFTYEFPDYTVKRNCNFTTITIGFNDYYKCTVSFQDKCFYRKACLNCSSCMDERSDAVKYLSGFVDELEQKKTDIDNVDEICGGKK